TGFLRELMQIDGGKTTGDLRSVRRLNLHTELFRISKRRGERPQVLKNAQSQLDRVLAGVEFSRQQGMHAFVQTDHADSVGGRIYIQVRLTVVGEGQHAERAHVTEGE